MQGNRERQHCKSPHLVLIIVAVCQKRDQLIAGALLTQGQRYCAQALYRIEPQGNVLILQLVTAIHKDRAIMTSPCQAGCQSTADLADG